MSGTQRPPDLWPEIERRLAELPRRRGASMSRVLTAAIAFLVFASSGVLLWRAFDPGERRTGPTVGPLDRIEEGWTRLPDTPSARPSASYVWTGSELLAWGGCEQTTNADHCPATPDGYAYDPAAERWSTLPAAPVSALPRSSIWTGTEAVFLTDVNGRLGGVAYDPAAETWRTIAEAPMPSQPGAVTVWTGSGIFVWGGGSRSDPALDGALYDPATNRWSPVAAGPVGFNLASGVWTGHEVIVVGSLLDSGNHAGTPTAVGAAYDPTSDTWRALPPSDLSPQAVSAVWIGDEMVAWDYLLRAQTYDPETDSWSEREHLPMQPSECYPDSAVVANEAFAFYCGQAAVFDPATQRWTRIQGGMLDVRIWSDAYRRSIQLWRFADLVSAGDVLFLPAEGITLSDTGEACYGCPGSPMSLWAYRPPVVETSEEGTPSLDALGRWIETDGVMTTLHDEDDGFTVTYPSDWFLAGRPINDWVCSPYEILALGTYPLRPGGHAVMDAQLPSNAVEDLGPDDILIWLNDSGSACGGQRRAGTGAGFPERPPAFGPAALCGKSDALCRSDGRNDVAGIRGWWSAFRDEERGFYVFVGMGERAYADPARARLAWEVLDSLRFARR